MDSWLTDAARIDRAAIERLIEGGASENEIREFKREMPLATDGQKDEFLKDITALANTEGGWLLVGIEERDEIAVAAPGIGREHATQIETTATNVMRERIEPPINTGFQHVDMGNDRVVLAIHARKSMNPPHAVVSKYRRLIFRRVGRRNDYAKVSEIRDMVLSGATMRERLEGFHRERLDVALNGGDGRAAPFDASRGVILGHILPLREFSGKQEAVDVRRLASRESSAYTSLLQDMLNEWPAQNFPSLDHFGYVQSDSVQSDSGNDRYVRFFDWGGIEFGQGNIIQSRNGDIDFLFPSEGNFRKLGDYISALLVRIIDQGIMMPYVGFISAAGIKNVFIQSSTMERPSSHNPAQGRILTDAITFGPVIFDQAPPKDARNPLADGLMDRIWRAAGKHRRPSEA